MKRRRITAAQRRAIERVEKARSAERQAGLAHDTARAGLDRAVYDALTDGVPAKEIAYVLKVTTSRVYQMRDVVLRAMQRSGGAG